jgi:hypothetical protein
MDDAEVLQRINHLVEEEHRLRDHAAGGHPLSDEDTTRLAALEVGLDQCWDLLRQRRAARETGGDPEQAHARPTGEVEGYLQ